MTDVPAAMAVLGEPGWRLLLDAGLAFDDAGRDPLRAAAALAKRQPAAPAAQRAVALELVTEGARLAAGIGAFERLLAPRGAAEQATRGRVATWHALRLDPSWRVVEIGCGAGGDSLAIAHRVRNLIACDADPVRAACAHMNLAALGLSNARAVPGDGFDVLAGEGVSCDAVFADPDRRPDGARTLDPEKWRPPLSRVLGLARPGRRAFVKAAPSLDADAVPRGFDVSYVSHDGECVEAFVESRDDGLRAVRAVLLPDDGPPVVLEGDRGDAPAGPVGHAILVPDAAAIRARLLRELCVRHGLTLVGDGIAWLTGPCGVESPWLRTYGVLASAGVADVPDVLREACASGVRVHVRGVPLAAPELEARWGRACVRGGAGGVLDVFVSRFLGNPGAVVARG